MRRAMRRNPFWCETYPDWQFYTVHEMRKIGWDLFVPTRKDCYHLYNLERFHFFVFFMSRPQAPAFVPPFLPAGILTPPSLKEIHPCEPR